MVSFCWFPPERRRAWAARVSIDSRVTASWTWRRSRPALIGPQRPTRLNSGMAMFSRMGRCGSRASSRLLGTRTTPRRMASYGCRAQRPAVDDDLAAGGLDVPGEDLEQPVLALALQGGQPQDLAGGDLEGDAGVLPVDEEVAHDQPLVRSLGLGGPLPGDVADPGAGLGEHGGDDLGLPALLPGWKEATSRPSRRTVHMSQCWRTSASRWEMNSTDRLRSFQRVMMANTRSDRSGGSAAVISSSISSCGSKASARARSSIRRKGRGCRGPARPGRARPGPSRPARGGPWPGRPR